MENRDVRARKVIDDLGVVNWARGGFAVGAAVVWECLLAARAARAQIGILRLRMPTRFAPRHAPLRMTKLESGIDFPTND